MLAEFSLRAIALIRNIPEGRVASYGQIAKLAGRPRGARRVAWLLHSVSEKYDLPWHRVVNAKGKISLREGGGQQRQKKRLRQEGVKVDAASRIDLNVYQWHPAQALADSFNDLSPAQRRELEEFL